MAGQNSNAQLQAEYDEALEGIGIAEAILENAYTPEATRSDLVAAVGDAIAALEDYETEEDDDGDTDADEDD